MRKPVLMITVLLSSATVAFAGPNEGATLTVQGAINPDPTQGDPCVFIPIPDTCEETIPMAQPDLSGVEWFLVLAAGASPLSFNTVTFGLGDYDSGTCYIGYYGPCSGVLNPLEIPSDGWPGPNTGTAVSWAPNCLEGMLVPIYFIGVYAYGPGIIPLGDFYPGQTAAFVSCDNPPVEDPMAGFGSFGCGGAQGEQACPDGEPGACCFDDCNCYILMPADCESLGGIFYGGPCDPNPCECPPGACCIDTNGDGNPETCFLTSQAECMAEGGEYQGEGTSCDPNPCPPDPIATQQRTWGQIKSIYR